MKNVIYYLLLFLIISCEEHEIINGEMAGASICGTPNPLEELEWLKARIEEGSENPSSDYCQVVSVTQGSYKGQTVFIPVLSGALCCTCGNAVYNCEGEVVFACDAEEEAKIENKKVIWEREIN